MSIAAAALIAGSTAAAQSPVEIDREVFLERSQQRDGRTQRVLAPADTLESGDTVILMLRWSTPDEAPFTITSRVPRALVFRTTGGEAPEVSVDGGRTWGRLADLRVGGRRATSADVTNIRWDVRDPRASRGRGVFTYSAVVR